MALLALAACSSSGGGGGGGTTDNDPPAEDPSPLLIVGWETTSDGVANEDPDSDDGDLRFARSTDGGQSWSTAGILNTDADSDGSYEENAINFATDGRGTWIAVWESALEGAPDIFLARSADDGETWGDPEAMTSDGFSEDADIAMDGQGNWIIAWETDGGEGDYDILFVVSSDNGESWSDSEPLASGMDNEVNVTLATDRQGRWLAVWEKEEGEEFEQELRYAFSDDLGETWDGDILDSDAEQENHDASIATDGAGVWVVVWTYTNDGAGDDDIWFARSDDNGTVFSEPALLHSAWFGEDDGADLEINHNSLATDGEGNWVTVWQSTTPIEGEGILSDPSILFSRSTDNGESWSEPAPLHTDYNDDDLPDEAPTVAVDSEGRWTAAWHAYRLTDEGEGKSPIEQDIFAVYSTDGGATWSDLEPLNTNAASDSSYDGELFYSQDDQDAVLMAQ